MIHEQDQVAQRDQVRSNKLVRNPLIKPTRNQVIERRGFADLRCQLVDKLNLTLEQAGIALLTTEL